jgi:hypothetical protein
MDTLFKTLEAKAPSSKTEGLISFGPLFGQEAANECCRRLAALGLKYVDDFFVFAPEAPSWCAFCVALNER